MKKVMASLMLSAALAACTASQVLSIQDSPIGVQAQGRDVGQVIEGALAARGWQVEARRPGEIDAAIHVREHAAAITIAYDADSYSIRYRDSSNLNYSDRHNTIHRNYNRWVANLDRDIQAALASPS